MQEDRVIPGKILYVSGQEVYISHGRWLFKSSDAGITWQTWAKLPVKVWQSLSMRMRLPSRLLRQGVHHLGMNDEQGVVLANRDSFGVEAGKVRSLGAIQGSRPLSMCTSGTGDFFYGEYCSNPQRSPVHIWTLDQKRQKWRSVWRFDAIRHVHGVYYDPYQDTIWVTTGDLNHEAGIWRTDDHFATLRKVVGGSQQFRAVRLLFTKEHVYFGSDAPDEQNYIYRMDREGKKIEKLVSVGNSVFHGCKVGNHLFFSTAVEPSTINTNSYAEVWGSADGKNWYVFCRFKKDVWPMKYFQYGQVLFPDGPGDGQNLWFTPFATKHDQKTLKLRVIGEL